MRRISILLILLSCVEAYSQEKISKRPNILWIVCEDMSPFLGAYGNHELKTPNIDQLAREGVRYSHVYTTAGVCAPSRSAIITGMYQTSIGTQHMRTIGGSQFQPVPSYSAVIPDYVKCFPEYLRKAGYYCTNNEKTDYQFLPPVTVWDESSAAASYRYRPKGAPFFSVFNLAVTHESMLSSRKDSLQVGPSSVAVPPIYPDIQVVRNDIARFFTNIQIMDQQVGEIIQQLKKDGLYDNTIIFFYSDHGGALPWMKREILERGTHIPLIIRFPKAKNGGTVNEDLISSIDFAPSVLSLAGIPIPEYLQGQAFLGDKKSNVARQYVFAARDRMDTEYDRVRMVRDKRYRYLYNYMPDKPYYQNLRYRLNVPMMKELLELKEAGRLDSIPMSWFKTKPVEELYDAEKDPFETKNLANDPNFGKKLVELRTAYEEWTQKVGDMSSIPEKDMINQMWNGKEGPPVTAPIEVTKVKSGILLSCATPGASMGYRIENPKPGPPMRHVIQSWDFGVLGGADKNGEEVPAPPAWKVYNGETITLRPGEVLHVSAVRIGYRESVLEYK